tara:strand:- start:1850 stop:2938 length:1089 start_codon:yes stop_codon:yes gene_type:complete
MIKKYLVFLTYLFIFPSCQHDHELLSSRSFNFTYSVLIKSTNGEKLEAWIPIPSSNEVQNITNLNINAANLNYSIKTEPDFGNKYLYILNEDGTTSDSKISVSFSVKRKEHKNVNYKNINPDNYLESYTTVPVGGVFATVIDSNKLNKEDIYGIYKYVLNGMHYGKPKSASESDIYYSGFNPKTNIKWLPLDQRYGLKEVTLDEVASFYSKAKSNNSNYAFGNGNSIYACDIGVGNCTDYHSYFMSLNRTLEVPARFHMGFPIPSGSKGKVKGYHCWADYYVEGEGWYPVDISEADKDPSKAEYFFGTVDENRVEMNTGRDFILEGYDAGPANLFIYPLVEVNDIASNDFSKSFTYENKVWQ